MLKLTEQDWRVIEFSVWKTRSLLSDSQEARDGHIFAEVIEKIGRDGINGQREGVEAITQEKSE